MEVCLSTLFWNLNTSANNAADHLENEGPCNELEDECRLQGESCWVLFPFRLFLFSVDGSNQNAEIQVCLTEEQDGCVKYDPPELALSSDDGLISDATCTYIESGGETTYYTTANPEHGEDYMDDDSYHNSKYGAPPPPKYGKYQPTTKRSYHKYGGKKSYGSGSSAGKYGGKRSYRSHTKYQPTNKYHSQPVKYGK